MSDKQTFAKEIVKYLQECIFQNQMSVHSKRKIMQDAASKYFTGQITQAQVPYSIKDAIENINDRISIGIIMRIQKQRFFQSKQNKSREKIIQKSEIIVQDEYGCNEYSEISSHLSGQKEIQELKQKISCSFKGLKTDFNKTNGSFFSIITDILSEIRQIQNSSNIKIIQKQAITLKNYTQKLFILSRFLVKDVQKCQNELKPLLQNKQKPTNKKDQKSEVLDQDIKSPSEEEQKVQTMSKKERLNLKKQEKLNDKIRKDSIQVQAKQSAQKSQSKKVQRQMKQQDVQDFQQENFNHGREILSNPALNVQKQSFNNGYFELLPAQEYIQRHFPKRQLHNRFALQTRSNGEYLDRVFNEVYKLDHSNVKIDFDEFLNYDWRNVEFFEFTGCQINSDGWNTLCLNSSLFPSLRFLSLASNKITEVYQEQLRQFLPHMKSIVFYRKTDKKTKNPLSSQSIQEIQHFLKNKNEITYVILF